MVYLLFYLYFYIDIYCKLLHNVLLIKSHELTFQGEKLRPMIKGYVNFDFLFIKRDDASPPKLSVVITCTVSYCFLFC